jgi:hypothetical protein
MLIVTTGFLTIAAAAPEGAGCADEIELLQAELAALLDGGVDLETVEVEAAGGPVELQGEDGGVGPQENWFGSPASLGHAGDQLDGARILAEQGDEAGCLAQVSHARQIMAPHRP